MTDTNEELPPDWAIEEALRRSSRTIFTVSHVREHAFAAASDVVAHARTIAKHEQPPVDPDVRLVADVINAFEDPTWVDGDVAMYKKYAPRLAKAVAVYRERKQ